MYYTKEYTERVNREDIKIPRNHLYYSYLKPKK